MVTLFIIIYISISNPILAILLSLALVLTLQELNKQVVSTNILDSISEEDTDVEDNIVQNQYIENTTLNDDIIGNVSLDISSDSQKLISTNLNETPTNNRVLESVPAHPELKSLDRQLQTSQVNTFQNQMGTQGLDGEITGFLGNDGIFGNASPF